MKIKLFICIFFIFAYAFKGQAKVLKYDISGAKFVEFSFKNACKEMGIKYPVLIDVKNPATLDCMGSEINLSKFCERKKLKAKSFLRGIVNQKNQTVVCTFGERVILSLICDKSHNYYCKTAKEGCLQLKKIYASKLELMHKSFTGRSNERVLSCYYANQKKDISKLDI